MQHPVRNNARADAIQLLSQAYFTPYPHFGMKFFTLKATEVPSYQLKVECSPTWYLSLRSQEVQLGGFCMPKKKLGTFKSNFKQGKDSFTKHACSMLSD